MGWLLKMPGTAIHRLSRHFEMSTFYLGENEPVFVRVLFAGKPKRVAGVDIEGTRSPAERTALLAQCNGVHPVHEHPRTYWPPPADRRC